MVIGPVIGILVLPPPLRGEVAASQNAVRKFRVETHTVFSQWDLPCPQAGLLCLRDDCSGNTSHSATDNRTLLADFSKWFGQVWNPSSTPCWQAGRFQLHDCRWQIPYVCLWGNFLWSPEKGGCSLNTLRRLTFCRMRKDVLSENIHQYTDGWNEPDMNSCSSYCPILRPPLGDNYWGSSGQVYPNRYIYV